LPGLCAGPRLICHRHGLVAGQDCWIMLDWCGVCSKLLHWSGFCWRCLSLCWTARACCSHIGNNCKWGSIPRVQGELAEDKGTSFGLQRGYAINHQGSGPGRHDSRGVCLPWLSYPVINRKHLWHQPPKCHHSCCHAELRKSDLEVTARHLNEVESVQHVYLTNIPVWAISKTDACKIDALDQWCLHMLLGIKWYQFVRNDDVRRLTKQPKLTAMFQSCWLTLFGHIMCMDDNADAKRILLASPPTDWRRQLGCPCITWLSTVHRIWNITTLHSQKQQIWRRTALCGGWCRRTALRNRELHARNDDDAWPWPRFLKGLFIFHSLILSTVHLLTNCEVSSLKYIVPFWRMDPQSHRICGAQSNTHLPVVTRTRNKCAAMSHADIEMYVP